MIYGIKSKKEEKQYKMKEIQYIQIYIVNVSVTDNSRRLKRIKIEINVDDDNKTINIVYPKELNDLSNKDKKTYIDKCMKKFLKHNTEILLENKVPYWSKITNIPYKDFKVNDATSKFGSCIPKTRIMHFSSRLIMLPDNIIDGIVVHELCHIIYPNHSKEFYRLVRKYIPDYDEINKWLKKNGTIIIF